MACTVFCNSVRGRTLYHFFPTCAAAILFFLARNDWLLGCGRLNGLILKTLLRGSNTCSCRKKTTLVSPASIQQPLWQRPLRREVGTGGAILQDHLNASCMLTHRLVTYPAIVCLCVLSTVLHAVSCPPHHCRSPRF